MSKWLDYNPTKNRESNLIKFLPEEFLFEFLKTGNIWFSRADEFGDKMECVTINDLEKKPFPFKELSLRKQKHLISCWHNVNFESIAMWDSSFKTIDKRRVYAIKFKTNDLIELMEKSYLDLEVSEKRYGSVVYKNILNDMKVDNKLRMKRCSFRKEASFRYEQEFRFVIKLNSNFTKKGIGIKIGNPTKMAYMIMVNPLLDKGEFLKYESMLLKDRIGKVKLKHSDLVTYLKPKEW